MGEKSFWEQFKETGRVDYYLNYRDTDSYEAAADNYAVQDGTRSEGKSSDTAKNSDGDRA